MHSTLLTWIDLETTGLDPQRDLILEVAIIVTTVNLDEVASWHGVTPVDSPEKMCSPKVAEMHEANGLFEECRRRADEEPFFLPPGGVCRADDLGLVDWIEHYAPLATAGQRIFAGNSVHFDRSFAQARLPRFAALHSHRVFDVRTLQQVDAWWSPLLPELSEYGSKSHRAMDDLRASLDNARAFRRIWRDRPQPENY